MTPETNRRLLITHARIIDGNGGAPAENQSILIEAGRIVDIQNHISADEARTIDAAGATVLPGLIDAHVHLQSVPGSVFRKDSQETLDACRYHQLRAYLACGVTTILDNAIAPSMLRKFLDYLASGGIGPRLYALAPAFYPPNGYLDNNMLTDYWGPQWRVAGTQADLEALFEAYEGIENIVGVKVLLESGPSMSIWPVHSPQMRKLIVEQAEQRGLPLYIHATQAKDQRLGLEMGVYNFVHSGFMLGRPSDDFINGMKSRCAYLTTTLSLAGQLLRQFDPTGPTPRLTKLAVPEKLLETAASPEAWRHFNHAYNRNIYPPWIPSLLLKALLKLLPMEKIMRACLANASKAVATLHAAGIPIVVGTDAACWPVFLNLFSGPCTLREIELLGRAGIPPMDVIASATRIPARMMGLDHLIGTVEVGKRADLIVVRDDPLKDLGALQSLQWTIKDGDARRPGEWMQW